MRKSGADSICVAGRRAASKLALRDASDAASDTRVKVLERELQKTRQELEDTKKTLREVRSGGDPDMESIGIAEMADLWSVIASLTANPMSEGGCPWTAEQGALDIIQHARSELEEIADELKLGSSSAHNALQSELGDMLFNTLLLIRVCQRDELGNSTLAGAAAFAAAKIRRRAPFVFGEAARPMTPQEASDIWKKVKQLEKVGLIKDCPVGYELNDENQWECKPVEGTQYFYGGFKDSKSDSDPETES